MSLPPPSGPVGRALQSWLESPTTATAHALATATSTLDPACDVLTDDDVQGSLRRIYDLAAVAPGPISSVTGLRELPPLVRARAALESALEFELRVGTAHHVALASDRAEPTVDSLLRLVDTMQGPALAAHLERHSPRHQVERRSPRAVPADGADAVPGHALVTGNVATMLRLHPRLRAAATGFEAARDVVTARTRTGLSATARRVGQVPLPVTPEVARDAWDERATVAARLGEVGGDAPDVANDVLLGAASYLYLTAVHESRLPGDRRDDLRPGEALPV